MKQTLFLKAVTGEEIEKTYNNMAKSGLKSPVATIIHPISSKEGTTDIFNVFIFFDEFEEKKKLKMEL